MSGPSKNIAPVPGLPRKAPGPGRTEGKVPGSGRNGKVPQRRHLTAEAREFESSGSSIRSPTTYSVLGPAWSRPKAGAFFFPVAGVFPVKTSVNLYTYGIADPLSTLNDNPSNFPAVSGPDFASLLLLSI